MTVFSRGSIWREWDLHVHTPYSFHWAGPKFENDQDKVIALIDQMIGSFNEARPAAFAIMDYWHFDGWFGLKTRLKQHGAPQLEKTIFPGIELRLAAPMKERLNAHVIFSNEIEDQDLKDFLSRLRLELIDKPLSTDALIEYARRVAADKLQSHGFTKAKVLGDDSEAYQAGCMIAEITAASYKDAIRHVPGGNALGFLPFTTNDGLASIDHLKHYAYALSLFESSPIFETRNPDEWAAFSGIQTQGNQKWFAAFQDALDNTPRLAVSGSDAHKFKGDGTNDSRGYGDFPSQKRTWIKADPTWKGLLQAVKEPAKRSFIGDTPEKLTWIKNNKTFYIDKIRIRKAESSELIQPWLDGTDIQLNPDLVAIIGNKGSGKSALADVLALLGNSKQADHFSFLKRNRFRGKTGEPARQFIGELTWMAGEPSTMALHEDPAPDRVELVRYIAQGRFEALCNDHVSGHSNAFEDELREVIFSHVPNEIRLGALSFDQLVDQQESIFRARISELQKSLHALNEEIVRLEDQLHPNLRTNLNEQVQLKLMQIEEHKAVLPTVVEEPSDTPTEMQQKVTERLLAIAQEHETLLQATKDASDKRQLVAKKVKALKNINARIALFESQFSAFLADTSDDLATVGIKADEFISISVNRDTLAAIQVALENNDIEKTNTISKLAVSMEKLLTEQQPLAEQLNEPQKRYQEYKIALKNWDDALKKIEGADTEPESLKGLQKRIEQLNSLPALYLEKKEARKALTIGIFGVLEEQRVARQSLFAPLQQLIQQNTLVREKYKLQFQARLAGSSESISADLFNDVKQSVGELRGEDESYAAIRTRFDKYQFMDASNAPDFASDVISLLEDCATKTEAGVPGIRTIMRKDKNPVDVYDLIFGLSYLSPKYSLLFQEATIEQLSPGQRGALLLIFYLLVDKARNPIVIDQPEENLDNETVVSLLVPVLNEAKKTRQIIMVTHNPNLAVVCDAEQIIHAVFERTQGEQISYTSGSIEDGIVNKAVVDVLEGTKTAFNNRARKYH